MFDQAVGATESTAEAASSACFVTDLFDDVCYVATAAHGGANAPEVVVLRAYRDAELLTNPYGRAFTKAYYAVGPIPAASGRSPPAAAARSTWGSARSAP